MGNLIGQSLGRYHILEQLGEGGMAVVYKAFDTRLERNVAIKVILPSKDHSEKFLKRFEREAKALAQLSHPNIVKVIDYGEHEGLPYLVMEYLPGGTLKQKLAGKPMPWQEAARILVPIARALAYAHESKIIHRDIKPSNILITESGEPMLSDFGIAKMLEVEETLDLTGTGVGVGTPEYMSPEQAQGQQVDARSDVYSLGVVLYEMVTGRKPYQADTPMAVIWKLASESLPHPKSFASGLPEIVEHILLKALSKSSADRFQDMQELVGALERALSGMKTRVSTSNRGVSKRLYLVTGLFALIGFSAVVYWGLTYSARNTETLQPRGKSTSTATVAVVEPVATVSDVTCEDSPSAPNSTPDFAFTQMELYDDFDESIYDELYNKSKWDFASGTAVQSRGDLTLNSGGGAAHGQLPLSVRNGMSARLCIPEFQGRNFSVLIKFLPSLEYYWHYSCWLTTSQDGTGFSCSAMDHRVSTSEFIHDSHNIPAQKGQWYRVDMEIDPQTGDIRSYLDDQLIDVYSPENAQDILKANAAFTVDTWAGSVSSGIALVDDVRLGKPVDVKTPIADSTKGTYLILEDFEDEQVQMYGFSSDSDLWEIVADESGNRVFQVDNRDGTGTPGFSFGADAWRDYIVEYRVRYMNKEYIGLQVRCDGLYSYIVNMGIGDLYLAYSTPKEWTRITTKSPPILVETWYTIRVIVRGDSIGVSIDDNKWIDERDPKYTQGWLMMFAEAGTYAQIDDIHVLEIK